MRNKIRGAKDIFFFTLTQSLKAKSMKIATLILCIIALISVPAISMIKGEEKKSPDTTSIKTVKVVDMTGLMLGDNLERLKGEDLYEENEKKIYTDIKYQEADIDYEKFAEGGDIKDIYTFDEEADYVYMEILYGAGDASQAAFSVHIIYSTDTLVKKKDVTRYNEFVDRNFKKILIDSLELTEEQQQLVNSVSVTKYQKEIDAEKEATEGKEDEKTAKAKYNIIYAVLMVIMFALAFGGERIAMSIVTEKASKVMEYLMTSVKPMAIVVGKIMANILILFIQGGLVILSFGISIVINGVIHSEGETLITVPSYISDIFTKTNFHGTNPLNILLAILIFIGGFICFGLIAGLAGASVSKMDEIAEGVKMYSMVLIIAAYLSLFVVTSHMYDGTSALRYFTMFFPFTSVFITPAALITGYATTVEALISLAVLVVMTVIMTKFVANVYESMIYYNGSVLKVKDIIQISKQNKTGKNNRKKEEE